VYVTEHHCGAGYLGPGLVSEKLIEAHVFRMRPPGRARIR
jgi:hypothetical protein